MAPSPVIQKKVLEVVNSGFMTAINESGSVENEPIVSESIAAYRPVELSPR
jgi:hypothetical protein